MGNMMKKCLTIFTIILLSPLIGFGQNFTFHVNNLSLQGNPGDLIQFDGTITNNSADSLSIAIIRSLEQLPANWSSSLCVGLACYAPDIDTVYIPGPLPFPPNPILPGENVDFFLDVFTDPGVPAGGTIKVRVENMTNPAEFTELTFNASTMPTVIRYNNLPITGQFNLHPNYPNPFNPSTTIPFEIGGNGSVTTKLVIFNIIGQRVVTLVDETLPPGIYHTVWDGKNNIGQMVSSGVYFYQLSAGNYNMLGKMILIK
jgi:hypothetical protein